ncbi:MAG: 1-aminocyclopropane-1-carboxylate deaminase/D-cysteine desulfhydrase [Acidimicrobiia bacterium]
MTAVPPFPLLPRTSLATLPTPLLTAPRLSEAVGVEVWIKRDDLTGLLLGGNKARKLEFLCGEAQAQGADALVTGGGSGSNHVQLTAAAAARLGLDCLVVCYGEPPAAPSAEPLGLRITRRLGADVVFTGSPERASVDARLEEVASKLTADGRHPYVIPRGGASATGAVGYALAAVELAEQLAAAGIGSAMVLLATGSCGTQAGLVAGAAFSCGVMPPTAAQRHKEPEESAVGLQVVGVPVSRPPEESSERVAGLATGCAERLGFNRVFTADDVHLLGGYLGPGYGKASPEGDEAARLALRTEGLVLDPVFTAKAMAALLAEARGGRLAGPVVFLHTGGTPAALGALP